jgi:hypothetical protein
MNFIYITISIISLITKVYSSKCWNTSNCGVITDCASSCTQYCVEGCIPLDPNSANINCINNTNSDPTYYIQIQEYTQGMYLNYSSLQKYSKSFDYILMKTEYDLNIDGNGTTCPIGCYENNKECEPLNTNYICYPQNQLVCPDSCIYDKYTNSCITNDVDTICETNLKYKKCPSSCIIYDNLNNSCYPSNPNSICGLEYKLKCPIGCSLNYYNKCVSTTNNNICEHLPQPQCPDGCIYDFTNHICTSNTQFCEPYITVNCNYDYVNIDINKINNCNYNLKNNIHDICIDNNNYGNKNIIKFPIRLLEKYKHIQCKYTNKICPTYLVQCMLC